MKRILTVIASIGIIGLGFISKKKSAAISKETMSVAIIDSYAPVAVLELFTSEGCSSCPPADRLLPELVKLDPNVIALSFHVDYWNRLGWKDPFSSSEFSDRQRQYGEQFHLGSVYTPQLVLNGEYEMVGSNRSEAISAIKKILMEKAIVSISIDDVKKEEGKLQVTCQVDGDLKKINLLAALVQKNAVIDVKAGENGGSKLSHSNVVRTFVQKPAQPKMNFEIKIPNDLANNNWRLILYTQQKGDLKITGAAIFQPLTQNP